MTSVRNVFALLCALSGTCQAARCTTAIEPGVLHEYEVHVAEAEQLMSPRFDLGELAWVPARHLREYISKLASGRAVKWNTSDSVLNRRIAGRNGTVIHWIGAIRIPAVTLTVLQAVLRDYDAYPRIYRPMITACRVREISGAAAGFDELSLDLQSTFRFASVIPQRYAFRAQARVNHSEWSPGGVPGLRLHLRASEIRESDSGAPGIDDFLDPYHDHGILWALNAYWRACQEDAGVYLEFETVTLARSAESFVCKIGLIPVPRSIVSAAMDSIPSESVTTILEGTKAECERRATRRARHASGQ
jgi:hypothetical protein